MQCVLCNTLMHKNAANNSDEKTENKSDINSCNNQSVQTKVCFKKCNK